MKLVVTANKLNKRKVIPVAFPDTENIMGVVRKGFAFEGVEVVNTVNPELGKWYKDRDGYFYWSSGLLVQPDEQITISTIPNWMQTLRIPGIWRFATGKNVGVAVIDTGISMQNAELRYNKNESFVFDNGISLQDSQGHGTHCIGLIGARNKNGKTVGICPDCNIYVCKIAEGPSLDEPETTRYAAAINWCADQDNIHVISISWGSFIRNKEILNKINAAIIKAVKKKKIIVCAVGDASKFNDPGPLYPAAFENTIGIGSIPVKDILYPYVNHSLVTMIDGFNIPSYGLNGQILEMTGTSQSNAIVAGIVALIIEKKKFVYDIADIRRILLGTSILQNFEGIQLPVLNGDLLLNFFQN